VANTSIDSIPAFGSPEILVLEFVCKLIVEMADALGRVNHWLHIVDLLYYYPVLDVTGFHHFLNWGFCIEFWLSVQDLLVFLYLHVIIKLQRIPRLVKLIYHGSIPLASKFILLHPVLNILILKTDTVFFHSFKIL